MIKTRAHIKLFVDGRKTPFENGYRPLFNFIDDIKTSGSIKLINQYKFYPGEEGEVEIIFLNKEYLGPNFDIGSKFFFGEGGSPLGEGKILNFEPS